MAVAEFFSFEGKDCLGGEKEEGKDEGSEGFHWREGESERRESREEEEERIGRTNGNFVK